MDRVSVVDGGRSGPWRGFEGVSSSDGNVGVAFRRSRVPVRSFLGDGVFDVDGVIWALLNARPSSCTKRIVVDVSSSSVMKRLWR